MPAPMAVGRGLVCTEGVIDKGGGFDGSVLVGPEAVDMMVRVTKVSEGVDELKTVKAESVDIEMCATEFDVER